MAAEFKSREQTKELVRGMIRWMEDHEEEFAIDTGRLQMDFGGTEFTPRIERIYKKIQLK